MVKDALEPDVLPTKRTESKRKKRKKKEVAQKPIQNLEALREKGKRIAGILEAFYPNRALPLDHEDPFQLLVSVLLSAQVS